MGKSQLHRRIAEEESPGILVYPDRRRMIGWIALSGVPALTFFRDSGANADPLQTRASAS